MNDTIGIQVYRTQDGIEVASAESDCTKHGLKISGVQAAVT